MDLHREEEPLLRSHVSYRGVTFRGQDGSYRQAQPRKQGSASLLWCDGLRSAHFRLAVVGERLCPMSGQVFACIGLLFLSVATSEIEAGRVSTAAVHANFVHGDIAEVVNRSCAVTEILIQLNGARATARPLSEADGPVMSGWGVTPIMRVVMSLLWTFYCKYQPH